MKKKNNKNEISLQLFGQYDIMQLEKGLNKRGARFVNVVESETVE